MKGKKIIIILIIINILSLCVIYNFIKKDYLNNEKIIVKAMTGTEYENNITSLNTAHEEYANYIEESKKKIASAITDMGVITSNEENLETMANNIKSIDRTKLPTEVYFQGKTNTFSTDIGSKYIVSCTRLDGNDDVTGNQILVSGAKILFNSAWQSGNPYRFNAGADYYFYSATGLVILEATETTVTLDNLTQWGGLIVVKL